MSKTNNFTNASDLMRAIDSLDEPKLVEIVAQHPEQINQIFEKWSPLMLAVYNSDKEISKIMAKYLISNGANVNAQNEDGQTPLMLAVENNSSIEVIEMLLDVGANLELRSRRKHTYKGATALFLGILHQVKHDVIRLLINRGANVNVQNEYGQTPLMLAVENNSPIEVIEMLLDAGANLELRRRGKYLYEEATALFMGVLHKVKHDVIQLLINRGADVNTTNKFGLTPLMLCSQELEITRMLIKAHADLDIQMYQETALMLAVVDHKPSSKDVVELLVKSGANVNLRNEDGLTAIQLLNKDNIYYYRIACAEEKYDILSWGQKK